VQRPSSGIGAWRQTACSDKQRAVPLPLPRRTRMRGQTHPPPPAPPPPRTHTQHARARTTRRVPARGAAVARRLQGLVRAGPDVRAAGHAALRAALLQVRARIPLRCAALCGARRGGGCGLCGAGRQRRQRSRARWRAACAGRRPQRARSKHTHHHVCVCVCACVCVRVCATGAPRCCGPRTRACGRRWGSATWQTASRRRVSPACVPCRGG
jgi:hypothetical protein